MYTAKDISEIWGNDHKIFFHIGERDVQAIAKKEFQITLSDEELEEVEENIEWGSFNWDVLVKTAIAKVLKEEYGYRRAKK